MIVHGKSNDNTEFRYVWARPKSSPEHKFHIAKRYSKLSQGHRAGKTVSICSHGFHWFKNEEVDFYEWKGTTTHYFHHCYFCIGNKKDINEKIQQYNETLPPAVHGKINGVAYRYVWARPGGKWQMRYHIARMFEGDFEGAGTKLKGRVSFLCSHYQEVWKRSEVSVKEWNSLPNYYSRCDFCSGQLEKYEGLVYQVEDSGELKQHKFQEHTDKATLNQAKEEQKKSDEEDILMDKTPEKKSKLDKPEATGRDNIAPPYTECVKCERRYAIDDALYIPLDGTGIVLETFDDYHTTAPLKMNIYKCVCGHPVTFELKELLFGVSKKVYVGKNVVK